MKWATHVLSLLGMLLAVVPVARGATAEAGRGHESCDGCHDRDWERLGADPAARSVLCSRCHVAASLEPGAQALREELLVSGHVEPFRAGALASELDADGEDSLSCLSCHAAHPNGQPHQLREDRTSTRSDGMVYLDPVSSLCMSCHVRAGRFLAHDGSFERHPVGVEVEGFAEGAVYADRLPLVTLPAEGDSDADGRTRRGLGCVTCHYVHTAPNPALLRWPREETATACGGCHPDQSGGRERGI